MLCDAIQFRAFRMFMYQHFINRNVHVYENGAILITPFAILQGPLEVYPISIRSISLNTSWPLGPEIKRSYKKSCLHMTQISIR